MQIVLACHAPAEKKYRLNCSSRHFMARVCKFFNRFTPARGPRLLSLPNSGPQIETPESDRTPFRVTAFVLRSPVALISVIFLQFSATFERLIFPSGGTRLRQVDRRPTIYLFTLAIRNPANCCRTIPPPSERESIDRRCLIDLSNLKRFPTRVQRGVGERRGAIGYIDEFPNGRRVPSYNHASNAKGEAHVCNVGSCRRRAYM